MTVPAHKRGVVESRQTRPSTEPSRGSSASLLNPLRRFAAANAAQCEDVLDGHSRSVADFVAAAKPEVGGAGWRDREENAPAYLSGSAVCGKMTAFPFGHAAINGGADLEIQILFSRHAAESRLLLS